MTTLQTGITAPKTRRVVVALGIGQTLGYASSFYLPAILSVPMARDLALPTWAIFAGLSAALLIAGALVERIGFIASGILMLVAGLLLVAAVLVTWRAYLLPRDAPGNAG